MTKKKQRSDEKYFSFNTHLLIYAAGFIVFLIMSFYFFFDNEVLPGILLLIFSFVPVVVTVLSPIGYVFSKKQVIIIYVLGDREVIDWHFVRNIVSCGSWFAKYHCFPYYKINYGHKKLKFYMHSEISKTIGTKKLIKKYYWKEIL